jgi:hypothetical protein
MGRSANMDTMRGSFRNLATAAAFGASTDAAFSAW